MPTVGQRNRREMVGTSLALLCPPCESNGLIRLTNPAHTFSNGTSISVRFSSHAGTGRFFERMNSGLNSFD